MSEPKPFTAAQIEERRLLVAGKGPRDMLHAGAFSVEEMQAETDGWLATVDALRREVSDGAAKLDKANGLLGRARDALGSVSHSCNIDLLYGVGCTCSYRENRDLASEIAAHLAGGSGGEGAGAKRPHSPPGYSGATRSSTPSSAPSPGGATNFCVACYCEGRGAAAVLEHTCEKAKPKPEIVQPGQWVGTELAKELGKANPEGAACDCVKQKMSDPFLPHVPGCPAAPTDPRPAPPTPPEGKEKA